MGAIASRTAFAVSASLTHTSPAHGSPVIELLLRSPYDPTRLLRRRLDGRLVGDRAHSERAQSGEEGRQLELGYRGRRFAEPVLPTLRQPGDGALPGRAHVGEALMDASEKRRCSPGRMVLTAASSERHSSVREAVGV